MKISKIVYALSWMLLGMNIAYASASKKRTKQTLSQTIGQPAPARQKPMEKVVDEQFEDNGNCYAGRKPTTESCKINMVKIRLASIFKAKSSNPSEASDCCQRVDDLYQYSRCALCVLVEECAKPEYPSDRCGAVMCAPIFCAIDTALTIAQTPCATAYVCCDHDGSRGYFREEHKRRLCLEYGLREKK